MLLFTLTNRYWEEENEIDKTRRIYATIISCRPYGIDGYVDLYTAPASDVAAGRAASLFGIFESVVEVVGASRLEGLPPKSQCRQKWQNL